MFQSQPNRHIFSRSKKFCTGGAKMWRFSGRMWQKTSQVNKKNSCAKASHSSQKCDKCDAWHFLSPKKKTNVTSLTQIWGGKLGRNPGKTDPEPIWAPSQLSVCSHTPTVQSTTISRFPYNYFRMWPLIFCQHTIYEVIWPIPGTLPGTRYIPALSTLWEKLSEKLAWSGLNLLSKRCDFASQNHHGPHSKCKM